MIDEATAASDALATTDEGAAAGGVQSGEGGAGKGASTRGARRLSSNVKVIDAVPTPEKRTKYSIKGKPGLSLIVFPSGRKVFYGDVRVGQGDDAKRTTVELGTFDRDTFRPQEANDALRAQVIKARTPEADKRTTVTFGDLFAHRHAELTPHRHMSRMANALTASSAIH